MRDLVQIYRAALLNSLSITPFPSQITFSCVRNKSGTASFGGFASPGVKIELADTSFSELMSPSLSLRLSSCCLSFCRGFTASSGGAGGILEESAFGVDLPGGRRTRSHQRLVPESTQTEPEPLLRPFHDPGLPDDLFCGHVHPTPSPRHGFARHVPRWAFQVRRHSCQPHDVAGLPGGPPGLADQPWGQQSCAPRQALGGRDLGKLLGTPGQPGRSCWRVCGRMEPVFASVSSGSVRGWQAPGSGCSSGDELTPLPSTAPPEVGTKTAWGRDCQSQRWPCR